MAQIVVDYGTAVASAAVVVAVAPVAAAETARCAAVLGDDSPLGSLVHYPEPPALVFRVSHYWPAASPTEASSSLPSHCGV